MYFKMFLTVIAVSAAALIAWQNMAVIQIKFFSRNISLSPAVLIFCFLIVGFGVGLLWRNLPRFRRGKKKVPLIRVDLRVCK